MRVPHSEQTGVLLILMMTQVSLSSPQGSVWCKVKFTILLLVFI